MCLSNVKCLLRQIGKQQEIEEAGHSPEILARHGILLDTDLQQEPSSGQDRRWVHKERSSKCTLFPWSCSNCSLPSAPGVFLTLLYFDLFSPQIPPAGLHPAAVRRGHLLPGADRAARGVRFRRGQHPSSVEVCAGLHGKRRQSPAENTAVCPALSRNTTSVLNLTVKDQMKCIYMVYLKGLNVALWT